MGLLYAYALEGMLAAEGAMGTIVNLSQSPYAPYVVRSPKQMFRNFF